MNPFYDVHDTSLSNLTDHDWQVLRSRCMRGIDWTVQKLGRKWTPLACFGKNAPLFTTKTAAGDYVDNLMRAERHYRSKLEWEQSVAA